MDLRWYQREAVDSIFSTLYSVPTATPLVCLPTGSGKSIVIAKIAAEALQRWGTRSLLLSHQKDILSQNAEKIASVCGLPVGVYSAGLRRRDLNHDILVAGIQSIAKRAHEVGHRDLVIVDECHLINQAGIGQYGSFLADLRGYCPGVRLCGLTATPYRLDQGTICGDGKIFSEICYEVPLRRLIDEGFLSVPVSETARAEVSTEGLQVRAGEFVEHDMQARFIDHQKILQACDEMVLRFHDRRHILVFCAGIDHANAIYARLGQLVDPATIGITHTEVSPLEASTAVSSFKNRQLRWMINCKQLTTGFDAPHIDAIALLFATCSAGLLYQIIGRGFRRCPITGKDSFAVCDFGGNLRRLGPIDSPEFGAKQRGGGGESRGDEIAVDDGTTKQCINPYCGALNGIKAAICSECKCAFPITKKAVQHDSSPDDNASVLGGEPAEPVEYAIQSAYLSRHDNPRKPTPSLRVDYDVSEGVIPELISEWVCLEHTGIARQKAVRWWREHSRAPVPDTINEAIELWRCGAVIMPSRIWARREGRFYRIIRREIDELPETWADAPINDSEVFQAAGNPIDDDEIPF